MKPKFYLALIIISLLSVTLSAVSSPAAGQDYTGYRHKGVLRGEKLPNGVKDLGGGLLSDENYGVTRYFKDKYMLWFEKIIDRDEKGVPYWEVKDVLVFNKPGKNQEFLFSYSSPCMQNETENLDLIVMAEFIPARKTYKVLKAWQANIETEKFEEISIEGISCQ